MHSSDMAVQTAAETIRTEPGISRSVSSKAPSFKVDRSDLVLRAISYLVVTLFALSFTTGPERQTVPVAVALFRGQHQVPWGQILAATVVSTLPVIALVALFQRRVIAGLTSGSVK